jgi:hypothetical protein
MHRVEAMSDQAKSISDQRQGANPQLYRDLALYLQVVRQVLPGAVDQAVFHLVTQGDSSPYTQQTQERRDQFHDRVNTLVRRCLSLLTVEQLVPLAAQMEQERHRRRLETRRQLMEDWTSESQDKEPDDQHDEPDEESDDESPAPPLGSVSLGLSIPGTVGLLGWRNGGSFRFGPSPEADSLEDSEPEEAEEGTQDDLDGSVQRRLPQDSAAAASLALSPLGLFSLGAPSEANEAASLASDSAAMAEDPRPSPAAAASPSPFAGHRMPLDPVLLLRWLEGIEQALARRLRNLSHALNVELLRLGVCRALLPVSLLDAVLQGQIDLLAAPANLLRLPLPFPLSDHPSASVAMALLLRGTDLEMEVPRLRTCRHRLQQHRQEVLKMAQQHRRLQRRLQAREAETLWLQDLHRNRPVRE